MLICILTLGVVVVWLRVVSCGFGLGLVLCLWVCLLPGCCLMTVGSLVVFAVGLVLCGFKLIVLDWFCDAWVLFNCYVACLACLLTGVGLCCGFVLSLLCSGGFGGFDCVYCFALRAVVVQRMQFGGLVS